MIEKLVHSPDDEEVYSTVFPVAWTNFSS